MASGATYNQLILADGRWIGPHGIGRFAQEVFQRLPPHWAITKGPKPLSPLDPFWLTRQISRRRPSVYFSPGFNPPFRSSAPFVFTIHDLIHLQIPEEGSALKRLYFRHIVRPAARRAFRVLTVSEFSRREIINWGGLPDERVTVVANGVDAAFSPDGPPGEFRFPYILYVGNRKPHKNLDRLLQALHGIPASSVRLVLSGESDPEIQQRLRRAAVLDRVLFAGSLPDTSLAALYRGAVALVLPSTLEGFGLPVLEAMASGTPVIAANQSALPEVAGEAALLVNPLDVEDIRSAILRVMTDQSLRDRLRLAGLQRARHFTWDSVSARVNQVLGDAARGVR